MNNEKKAPVLKLEHIAPYLPYRLNMQNEFGDEWTINMTAFDPFLTKVITESLPILRPLSGLTVEFFKENIDDAIVDFLINCEPEHNHFSVEVCDKVIGWTAISYEEYQLFFKNHFDVFGLIEKGLAVDINSIEGKENENAS